MGGLGSNFHTFLSNFIFFKEFCPISSSFCGLEGHFQGEIEENFFLKASLRSLFVCVTEKAKGQRLKK